MSGDWLKVEIGTPDKPEVWAIAARLNIDADAVFGKLFRVWSWFDQQTNDGVAPKVSIPMLDRLVGVHGFCDAMVAANWMVVDGANIHLPGFDKHNGNTAKRRAETARRVAKHKASKDGNEKVTRNKLPRPIVSAVKQRDTSTCVYCGRREGEYGPTETAGDAIICIDHVIPLAYGGSDDVNNLVCACSVCNLFKSDRTPDECGLKWPTDAAGKRLGNKKRVTSALPKEDIDIKPSLSSAREEVTRVPDDYQPPKDIDARLFRAGRRDVDPRDPTLIALFITNHQGKGTCSDDWDALFLNWCLRERKGAKHETGRTENGRGARSPMSAVDRVRAANAGTGTVIDGKVVNAD